MTTDVLTTPHVHTDKVEPPKAAPAADTKASNEAQDLLRQHSNLWTQGSTAINDGFGIVGGAHPGAHMNSWDHLKGQAGATGKESADNGKALKDITDKNSADAKHIGDETKTNTTLGDDAHTALNDWARFNGKDSKKPLTEQNLAGLSTYEHEHGNEKAAASIDNVLHNWGNIKDMTDGGEGKSISNRSVDGGLKNRQDHVDGENKDLQKNLATQNDMKQAQGKDGQTANDAAGNLTPNKDLLEASKVQKGDGYYQVAQRMLGLDHQQHSDAEVKDLTKVLQDQMAKDKRSPAVGQSLVDSENFGAIMDRIRGEKPAPEAPKTDAISHH
jgi:hypothetical protein